MIFTGCSYPTYYDSESSDCVFTCPSGTIGNVTRTANGTTRSCDPRKLKIIY